MSDAMTTTDPFNLQRFVDAQAFVYEQVCAELRAGRKTSHWIWFIFPQIAGLGYSPMAQRFAISGRAEAVSYLQHPVLGPRLAECTRLVNAHAGSDIVDMLGEIDAIKFRSSMTLFATVASEPAAFLDALHTFCRGERDRLTLEKL
jgi:uncharacterized protein (DUF1810 family)